MKYIIWGFFLILIVANIFVFMSGTSLSNQITQYQANINQLSQANMDLERKVYGFDSLTYATQRANQLNFTQKASPVYLDNLKYAFK